MADLTGIFEGGFNADDPAIKDLDHFDSGYGATTPDEHKISFCEQMRKDGFTPPHYTQIPIGQIMRMSDGTKKNDDAGWFIYHEIENEYDASSVFGVGSYGTWRDEGRVHKWVSKSSNKMTMLERELVTARQNHAKELHEKEQAKVNREAAEVARDRWKQASKTIDHGYVKKKSIEPVGCKQDGSTLLIPCYDIEGNLMSLQQIYQDSEGEYQKRFMKGSTTKFGMVFLEGDRDTVYICEGWATGCSILEATGKHVVVVFNSGNLVRMAPVVKKHYGDSRIIIAADNDLSTFKKDGKNPGEKAAKEASAITNLEYILCPVDSDFNDLHAQKGLKEVKKLLDVPAPEKPEPEEEDEYSAKPIPEHLLNPPGILKDICIYHDAIGIQSVPMLGVQTALAVCGTALSRLFITNLTNMTTMYYINVARSAQGKGNIIGTSRNIFKAWDTNKEWNGSGDFTSDAGIHNVLMQKPKCLAIVDEFAHYLANIKSGGQSYSAAVAKTFMEIITETHGEIKTKNYSAGAAVGTSKAPESKYIYQPALNMVGITTPEKLFEALGTGEVKDGFLNRIIVAIYDTNKRKMPRIDAVDDTVPKPIIDWYEQIKKRTGNPLQFAEQEADLIEIEFFHNCDDFLKFMGAEQIRLAEQWDSYGFAELAGRLMEWAMRLSLICALAENPNTEFIDVKHLEWSWDYVNHHMEVLIFYMNKYCHGSEYAKLKAEIVIFLEKRGKRGATISDFAGKGKKFKGPINANNKRDRDDCLRDLLELEEICVNNENTGKHHLQKARPVYRHIKYADYAGCYADAD